MHVWEVCTINFPKIGCLHKTIDACMYMHNVYIHMVTCTIILSCSVVHTAHEHVNRKSDNQLTLHAISLCFCFFISKDQASPHISLSLHQNKAESDDRVLDLAI